MERVCFELQVKPECIQEYRRRHVEVWPEMLRALQATGWRNYSLFLRPDGLLIGYFETDDLQACLDGMAATQVDSAWQTEMAPLFADPAQTPDHGLSRLDEVFNLDAQLDRLA